MRLLLSLLLLQTIIYAAPEKVDIYFLSAIKKQTLLFNELESKNLVVDMSDCIETEAGCFHPQLGLVKEAARDKTKDEPAPYKTINAMETNLIDCKKGNYFDIYCGKSKPIEINKAIDYEVWIDTSSSLRQFDWDDDPARCVRRSFIERFQAKCNLEIKVFDTSLKQMGDLSSLCVNHGLNDQNRMINWIENSNAAHLIIVTDIDEASTKVRDYLFKIGANLHGADYGDMNGDKILNEISKYESTCQKKK